MRNRRRPWMWLIVGAWLAMAPASSLADGMYTVTFLGPDRALGVTNGGDVISVGDMGVIQKSGPTGTTSLYHGYGPQAGQIKRDYPSGVLAGQSGRLVTQTAAADGSYHATLYNGDGGTTDLGRMEGRDYVVANAANSSNQVAGVANFPVPGQSYTASHTTLLSGGQSRDLGTFGGGGSFPVAMNEAGQIAGRVFMSYGEAHGYLWNPDGTWKDIGTPALPVVYVTGMNDKGAVVGIAGAETYRAGDLTTTNRYIPFVYDATGMHALAKLGDSVGSIQVNAINNLGEIVGTDNGSYPVLFRDGKMINLNKLIPDDPALILSNATGINDLGQIVVNGSYLKPGGGYTPMSVLLTPEGVAAPTAPELPFAVPEPTPLVMLGLGGLGLALRSIFRRR